MTFAEEREQQHRRDVEALEKAKMLEKKLLKKGKLHRVEIVNGYAMTTRPEDFENYKPLSKI